MIEEFDLITDNEIDNFWVTSDTEITLTAIDHEEPCAVGVAGFHVLIEWDSDCSGEVDTVLYDENVPAPFDYTFTFGDYYHPGADWKAPFECLHKITWSAYDLLGNIEEPNEQYHKVDDTPPHILILKPVDGWYSDGEDIAVVAVAQDLTNPHGTCDIFSDECSVGIEDGAVCEGYFIDLLPFPEELEDIIIHLESHMTYNAEAHECQGYVTIPEDSGIPDGAVIFAMTVQDNLGNEGNSIIEILHAIMMDCAQDDIGCITDVVQDIVTIWNLPKIGIDNNPPEVNIMYPTMDSNVCGGTMGIQASVSDGADGDVTSTITTGTPCYVTLDGVALGTVPYSAEYDMCEGLVSVPETMANGDEIELSISVTDNGGNIGTGTITVSVDTIAPTVEITAPEEGSDVNGIVSVTWDSSETTTDMLSIDGGEFFAVTSSYDWDTTVEEEGTHTLTIRVADSCGHTGEDTIIVQVDNTVECPAFVTPDAGEWYTEDQTVEVTVPGDTSKVVFSSDCGSMADDTDGSDGWSSTAPLGSGDGSCTITAQVYDELDNPGCSRTLTVNMDNSGPSASYLVVADPDSDDYDTDGDITTTWTEAVDSGVGVDHYVAEVSDDGFATIVESGSITELFASFNDVPEDGEWCGRVYAVDMLGNAGGYSNTACITVDREAPALTITEPVASQGVSGVQDITYSATDENGISGYEVLIDGATVQTGESTSYSWDTTGYYDGTHTIKVIATDDAGLTDEEEVSVSVENTPGCLSIIAPDAGEWYTEDQTVEVTSTDDTSRIDFSGTCSLDSASDTDGSDGWTTTALLGNGEGSCTITAEAFDELGDSICSRTIAVNRDNSAPVMNFAMIADDGDGYDTDGDLSAVFEGSDGTGIGVDHYHVTVTHTETDQSAGSDVTELFASFNDVLYDGEYCGEVYAVDELGNAGDAISTGCIIVDRARPITVVVSGIDVENEPYDTNGEYSITWSDSSDDYGISGYDIMINGDVTTDVSKPYPQSVEDGTYDYKVRAVDNAGNRGEWSDTYTVAVDTESPEILFVNPTEGGVSSPATTLLVITNENTNCEYVVGESDSEEMDGETTTHSADLTGMEDGDVTITVYCEDVAGNEAEESVTFTVTSELPQTSSTVVDPMYTNVDPRITAQIESQNSPIEEAKYCILRPGPDAEEVCYEFDAQDGVFDEYKEAVESVIDISELDEGVWVVHTSARDALGWGVYDAELFVVDRFAPIIDEENNPLTVEGSAECYEEYDIVCSGTPTVTCEYLGEEWGQNKCYETLGCNWVEEYANVCTGEPETCGNYDAEQCVLFDGCELVEETEPECIGTPADQSCSPYDIEQCTGIDGCDWITPCEGDPYCEGTPTVTCEYLGSEWGEDKCIETMGCEWDTGSPAYCLGIPTDTCEDIQSIGEDNGYENKCEETPGCYWDNMFVDEYCEGTPAEESCAPYDEEQCLGISGCEWAEEYGWVCVGSTEFELKVETNEAAYCEYSESEFALGDGVSFLEGQWTDQHISTVVVPGDGYYMYFVICKDYVGQESTAVINVEVDSVMDTDAPMVIGSAPEGTVETNEVTITAETDGYAHCEYSTAQFELGNGAMFETTGTTTHEQVLTLSDGHYVYFVRCEDYRGNVMATTEEIIFDVDTSWNFDITVPESGYWNIGWHEFRLPKLMLDDINFNNGDTPYYVADVLSSINGGDAGFDIIYYHNGADWTSYVPGRPVNDLTEFNDEMGNSYFIKMNRVDRIEINGEPLES